MLKRSHFGEQIMYVTPAEHFVLLSYRSDQQPCLREQVKEDWCNTTGIDLHTEIAKRSQVLKETGREFFYQCPCAAIWGDCWNPSTGGPPPWISKPLLRLT